MKELVKEIERLGKNLSVGEVGDNLGLAKHKVYQLIKQYRIPYEKKNPTACVRRRLTRKVFEARVRGNYKNKKTIHGVETGADVFLRQESGRLLVVMEKGKLKDSPEAVKFWKEKIDKAWKRRNVYSLGCGEEVE